MPCSRIEAASSSSSSRRNSCADCADWGAETRSGLSCAAGAGALAGRLLAVADQGGKAASQPRALCRLRSVFGAFMHFRFRQGVASVRASPLALDHFRRELEIGLAADAFQIVKQHRLAIRGRLGDAAHCAG